MREVKHCRVVVEISSHYSRLGGLPETGHSESHRRQRFHLSDRTIEPFFEPITALIGALNDKLSLQQKEFIAILPCYPHSVAKSHQDHLHQHHLLTCIAYTIIANHKQIGSEDVAPGGTKLPPDGFWARKVRKIAFVVNRIQRASPGMAPGGQMGAARRCLLYTSRSEDVAPGGTKLPPDGFWARKVRKIAFVVNRIQRASPGMAPGGQMGAARRCLLYTSRSEDVAPGGTKLPPDGFWARKSKSAQNPEKTSKSSLMARVAWRFNQYRQALHKRKPKIGLNNKHCLAVLFMPPGGFPSQPRNAVKMV
ncbi:hypothetical protein DEO72_LG8g1126 [Vigna unguiculata]|uniref:Uncharacterized protein n=1 Tax=Vigna unguiculata TaxID=3917 RepID=A0A4D6MTB2_VIGUN|nr:hypothetical protein DEO72_LG8g1126 [Vigna unguiculata]